MQESNESLGDKAAYQKWVGENFHNSFLREDDLESGYRFTNQCGKLVKIPQDVTSFERQVLAVVREAQKALNQYGKDFELVFYPEPEDQPGGFPELLVLFARQQIIKFSLQPDGSNAGEVHWYPSGLVPEWLEIKPRFTYRRSPMAVVLMAINLAEQTVTKSLTLGIIGSSTRVALVSLTWESYSSQDLSDLEAMAFVDELLFYEEDQHFRARAAEEAFEPEDDLSNQVCSGDGECIRGTCWYCDGVRVSHATGECKQQKSACILCTIEGGR